jgi:hypothetical protein
MKTKTFKQTSKFNTSKFSLLFVPLFILFFAACGNDASENSITDGNTPEDELHNKIEGKLPPAMSFYEVNMAEDEQTVNSLSENTFKIIIDNGDYWANWKYGNEEDHEEIIALTEKEPNTIYQFQTIGEEGSSTYTITKINEDGLWVMTNSNNNHKGYLCDMDAAIIYEESQAEDILDDTPQEIVASLGLDWIALTKQDGKWIIYNECRYGSGGLHFDENGEWLEFHGGGDAYSKEILEMKRIDYNVIQIKYKGEFDEEGYDVTFTSTGEDNIIVNEGSESESAFLLRSSPIVIETVDEECDE